MIALRIALERGLSFMSDLIIENVVMTQNVLALLASEKQHRMLVEMLYKPNKPIKPLFAPNSLDTHRKFSTKKKDQPNKVNSL